MFDRILLLLLLLLLPIGIIASRIMSGEIKVNGVNTSAQEQKIDTLIANVSQQVSKLSKTDDESFSITGTIYASESATLTVAGIAPDSVSYIWVWTAGSVVEKNKKDASQSATKIKWLGPEVVKPAGSSFSIPVDVSEYVGVVEVRLEQKSKTGSVRYDLDKKVQVQ